MKSTHTIVLTVEYVIWFLGQKYALEVRCWMDTQTDPTTVTLAAHARWGLINPRCACAARVTIVVCLSFCLSVESHLTSGASVRPENAVTYSADNEGEKICGVFFETALLPRSSTFCIVWLSVRSAIFTLRKTRIRIIRPRIVAYVYHLLLV